MPAGYNHRCINGSKEAIQKAKMTKKKLEDMEAERNESAYLESEETSSKELLELCN